MENHRNYQDNHAYASALCTTLPASQYDARNVTGSRFFEIGATFDIPIPGPYPASPEAEPKRFSVPIQDQLQLFSYNISQTFRIVTIGIDSYSVRHAWNTAISPNPVNGFVEIDREPVCMVCPQLQVNTKSRYFCMLPNDFGQGLAGAAQVSFIDTNLPNQLDFSICLLNPIPTDETNYNVNQTRTLKPEWNSQYVRSLTLRLFVKATFEPNQIPVFGINANNGIGTGGGFPSHPQGFNVPSSGNEPDKKSRLRLQIERIQRGFANATITAGTSVDIKKSRSLSADAQNAPFEISSRTHAEEIISRHGRRVGARPKHVVAAYKYLRQTGDVPAGPPDPYADDVPVVEVVKDVEDVQQAGGGPLNPNV